MPRYVCTATVPSPTLGLIQPGDIVDDVSNIEVLKKDGQLRYFRKMEEEVKPVPPPKAAKARAAVEPPPSEPVPPPEPAPEPVPPEGDHALSTPAETPKD